MTRFKKWQVIPLAAVVAIAACSSDTVTGEDKATGGVDPQSIREPLLIKGGGGGGNPQYQSSDYAVSSSTFGLNHQWRQVGMGNFTTVDYELTAQFVATVHCENSPGKTVAGAPFQIEGTASTNASLEPRNGVVNGNLTLSFSPASTCQGPGNNPHAPVVDFVTWDTIKFCWGNNLTQGPVPGGPNSGVELDAGDTDTGEPLKGDAIYATCRST